MTIDEAIKFSEENADYYKGKYEWYQPPNKEYLRISEMHKQIGEWLKDYKCILEKENEDKCSFCKHNDKPSYMFPCNSCVENACVEECYFESKENKE